MTVYGRARAAGARPGPQGGSGSYRTPDRPGWVARTVPPHRGAPWAAAGVVTSRLGSTSGALSGPWPLRAPWHTRGAGCADDRRSSPGVGGGAADAELDGPHAAVAQCGQPRCGNGEHVATPDVGKPVATF